MKIYTRAGDDGETGLFGGERVAKDDRRVEAYGTVDELNCALGVARAALSPDSDLDPLLARVQGELFDLGAELATPPARRETRLAARIPLATDERTAALEAEIDRREAELEPLKTFILPGGTPAAAALHVARATCRRAERRVITLAHVERDGGGPPSARDDGGPASARDDGGPASVRPEVLRYLNRLSDLLFVLARYANHRAGVADTPWHPA